MYRDRDRERRERGEGGGRKRERETEPERERESTMIIVIGFKITCHVLFALSVSSTSSDREQVLRKQFSGPGSVSWIISVQIIIRKTI